MKDFKTQIREALDDRLQYVLSKAPEVVGTSLREMEDAPDQQISPLTREQVKRMLFTYEMRSPTEFHDNFVRERSIEGSRRVTPYTPDESLDYMAAVDTTNADQINPGKQEPWEFVIDPTPIGYEKPEVEELDDTYRLSGMDKVVESTDVLGSDPSINMLMVAMTYAVESGDDIKLELEDGNDVYLDSTEVAKLLKSGFVHQLKHAMIDINTFASFVSANHVPFDAFDDDTDEEYEDATDQDGDAQ